MRSNQPIYNFGPFVLDAEQRSLQSGDNAIQLPPKAFDTLLLLVEMAGKVVSKEKMMAAVWDDAFVEENNLAQNISLLRRALGENTKAKYIETVPKFGYRFVAPVESFWDQEPVVENEIRTNVRVFIEDSELPSGASQTSTLSLRTVSEALKEHQPETRYVQNGDVNIAYQVLGNGPIDVVFVMGWISHLEYFWKHHLFATFLDRLASFSRLILFDKRGTGLSDRVPLSELPTLEQRMEDVHAVMDAVGSERAVLIGVSEGGPMCSLFAATYPERTTALVMIGTYAKRIKDDDYPWAPSVEQRSAFFDLVKRDWGKPVGIDERAPSLAQDEEFREWWATYLRMGASPGAAVALTQMNAEIDVRNVLPLVRVPTLVIHRTGDKCLKVEEGRYVAEKIPGSRFVEFEGDDHLPFVGDQESILNEIERFVTGTRYAGDIDRVLATVMNVRIIDPAAEADKRGNESWHVLLDRAQIFVRRQLELFKGRETSFGAHGVVATFDGPARAIRCAKALMESAGGLGVRVQAGLHTGECDLLNGVYSGFAFELAGRIADVAEPGNILVSRTVKDLVAGSGIDFTEAGIREFDGVDGEWRLFTIVN